MSLSNKMINQTKLPDRKLDVFDAQAHALRAAGLLSDDQLVAYLAEMDRIREHNLRLGMAVKEKWWGDGRR